MAIIGHPRQMEKTPNMRAVYISQTTVIDYIGVVDIVDYALDLFIRKQHLTINPNNITQRLNYKGKNLTTTI